MKQLEKLKTLHTILGAETFILTGTTALAYHGLMNFESAKDLDILLIKPTPAAIEVLKSFQSANPSSKFKQGGPVDYSFYYEGVKIDVWILLTYQDGHWTLTQDGIRLASIQSIVDAKIKIGRAKDWIQLMQLSKKIFNPSDFNNILPSLSTRGDDDSYENED